MNRAQKNAWFGLANCLLAIGFSVFLFYRSVYYVPVPGFRFSPEPSQLKIIFQAILNFWPLVLPVIALVLLLVPRKKQSPAEPDFDELDAAIQNKATCVSFISVWLLWPLVLMILMLRFGMAGTLSTIELFCIFFGLFFVCMTIYFSTTVILYKKQTQGGIA